MLFLLYALLIVFFFRLNFVVEYDAWWRCLKVLCAQPPNVWYLISETVQGAKYLVVELNVRWCLLGTSYTLGLILLCFASAHRSLVFIKSILFAYLHSYCISRQWGYSLTINNFFSTLFFVIIIGRWWCTWSRRRFSCLAS